MKQLTFKHYSSNDLTIGMYFDIYNKIEKHISLLYPSFKDWFFDKIFLNKSTSFLYVFENEIFVGISILKITNKEKKIRTVFVFPEFQNNNHSLKIFNEIEKYIPKKYISFSFPEEYSQFYIALCQKKKYKITHVKNNYYRFGKTEYFVNFSEEDFIIKY